MSRLNSSLKVRRSHLLCPTREVPSRADESMCVKNSVDDCAFHYVGPDDCGVHGIRVLSPGCLCDRLPRMTVNANMSQFNFRKARKQNFIDEAADQRSKNGRKKKFLS